MLSVSWYYLPTGHLLLILRHSPDLAHFPSGTITPSFVPPLLDPCLYCGPFYNIIMTYLRVRLLHSILWITNSRDSLIHLRRFSTQNRVISSINNFLENQSNPTGKPVIPKHATELYDSVPKHTCLSWLFYPPPLGKSILSFFSAHTFHAPGPRGSWNVTFPVKSSLIPPTLPTYF